MAATRRARRKRKGGRYGRVLVPMVIIVGILYVAKPVVVPLALAVLLTFVLTPLVISIQRRGLKRVPAVLIVVVLTFATFGIVGWGVGTQVANLVRDLPRHAEQVKAKIARLQTSGNGPVSRLLESFRGIGDAPAATTPGSEPKVVEPPVVVTQAEESFFSRFAEVATSAIEPIASAALILVLVIFMLIKREDLRNRVIGLLGHGRLTGTTRVLVESAQRLSRLLLMQLAINTGFGILFGIALLLIGVPYWFLWGFLAVVLRFIPYVGSWMAAAFPILLSFAIAPGWGQPLLVLAVFIGLDVTTANVVEPLLFGHSTGVSPVALLVAAVFWTWVWGPIGLVLSTPLTLCLVVLGQHVPRLRFLALLLGDQPALSVHAQYYQRLLAGDRDEALLVAKQYARLKGPEHVPDDVLIPALRYARRDRQNAGLTATDETFIFEVTQELVEDLGKTERITGPSLHADATPESAEPLILGCPAHHKAEELTVTMLRNVLAPGGYRFKQFETRTLPVETEAWIAREKPDVVFIAILPPGGIPQARYLCRRLRKRFPELKIVVGYWGKVKDFDRLLVRLRSSGASYVVTSVIQGSSQIRALLTPVAPQVRSAPMITVETVSVAGVLPSQGLA
jgi:predicted PurR-regulated permease PerM